MLSVRPSLWSPTNNLHLWHACLCLRQCRAGHVRIHFGVGTLQLDHFLVLVLQKTWVQVLTDQMKLRCENMEMQDWVYLTFIDGCSIESEVQPFVSLSSDKCAHCKSLLIKASAKCPINVNVLLGEAHLSYGGDVHLCVCVWNAGCLAHAPNPDQLVRVTCPTGLLL